MADKSSVGRTGNSFKGKVVEDAIWEHLGAPPSHANLSSL